MMTELYFVKPDTIDEVARQTGLKRDYLQGLLDANDGKTVNLQINTANVPEGFGRTN